MKPRHLKCFAHFDDPPDGSIDVRESVYTYKENIVREHPTGPQYYPDNGLVSGTKGEVFRNQEENGDVPAHFVEVIGGLGISKACKTVSNTQGRGTTEHGFTWIGNS
ncbi:hypothetical protein AVEN_85405-1 [Araneus ventricosus]|uniref:Uncharacterized protein n=1 Tax=Araneus ventricosus TaxID=182803 RepID=A0A4Y2FIG0_ARAVE|nr:hypothetical protein AVEN_85405-1 [Araneus ventricosus]